MVAFMIQIKNGTILFPYPFRIKMPLELVYNNLDEDDFEFDFLKKFRTES